MSDSFVTVAAAAEEAGVAQGAAPAPTADDAIRRCRRRVNYEILNRRNDNITGGFLMPKSDLI